MDRKNEVTQLPAISVYMFFGSYFQGLPQSFRWMCLMMDSQCRGLFPNVIKTLSVFYNQVGLTKTVAENWDSK